MNYCDTHHIHHETAVCPVGLRAEAHSELADTITYCGADDCALKPGHSGDHDDLGLTAS